MFVSARQSWKTAAVNATKIDLYQRNYIIFNISRKSLNLDNDDERVLNCAKVLFLFFKIKNRGNFQ